MFAIFILGALTLGLLLAARYLGLYWGSSRLTTVPGLEPINQKDGNLADMSKAGSLHEFLMDLHKQFGDIASFWIGEQLVMSIASPALFKENITVFDRPPLLFKLFEPIYTPQGIQYANGLDGHKRRNKYDKAYSHEAVMGHIELFNELVSDLCTKMNTLSSDEHVPLREFMFAIAIKAITITSMGKTFRDDKEVSKFRNDYDICWGEMESHLIGDIPDPDSPRQKLFEQSIDNMFRMVKDIIADRKEHPPSDGEEILIDLMMRNASSKQEAAADALTFTIGGFHTTGLLLTWCIYFLATHTEIQDKVYEELAEVLGDQDVTSTVIGDLVYLRQVLDETMRCSVLAPYAARFQDIDVTLGGHKVPAGTPVVHALGVVLQDPRLYPSPTKFDPGRFSPENFKKLPIHSFEPFGFAGKRKCPGYRLAYAEATTYLSVLLRKFKFRMVEGQVVKRKYGLVTTPVDEIWVTIEKRK